MSMDGFFTLDKEEKKTTARWTCKTCKLYESSSNPKLEPTGRYKKKIMIIGSGYVEDQYQKNRDVLAPEEYFKTEIGRYLLWAFRQNGISIENDCVYLNSINCSSEDRNINATHLGCCRQEKVLPAIELYKPKAIFLLGIDPLTSVIAHRWGNDVGGLTRWRGCKIPDHELGAWVFPIDGPEDIRNNSKAYQLLWRNDIQSALAMDILDFPTNPLDDIEIRYMYDGDVGEVAKNYCSASKLISFDYETSGLRPYRDGHQIYCASIARSEKHGLSFMFPDDVNSSYLDGFIDVLRDRNVKKMSHNMCFEELWSRWILGTQVFGWEFDSMLAAHVLDSRPKFTGLKFQSYINFGVLGYEKALEDYIGADSTDGRNNIDELVKTKEGQTTLLKYCGIDSCLQFRLARLQAPVLGMELG